MDLRATTPLKARPGGRHALRRRRRHGDPGRRGRGRAARRATARPARRPAPPRDRARRRAAAGSTTRSRPSSPASRRSRSCAAATRASTSACTSTWPPTSSRSARTCWPGGELAAMVVCDAVIRKLPGRARPRGQRGRGVVQRGARGRSEYPHYTRPADWRGHEVPEVLLSGDHARPRVAARAEPHAAARPAAPAPEGPCALAFATIARRARRRSPASRPSCAMTGVIDSIERAQLRRVPAFQAGDRVRVHFQVVEGTRRRTQVFEGIVIKRQGSGVRETFTVRKQSFGVGVERTFPVHSPKIERIEVAARGDVRRAKLYYLRDRVGRARARARAPLDRRRRRSSSRASWRPARCRRTTPRARARSELGEAGGREAEARGDGARRGRRPRAAPRRSAEAGRPRRAGPRPRPRATPSRPRPSAEPTSQAVLGRGREAGTARRGEKKGEERRRLAARARHDRRGRARARARHPGVPRQAVPDPERVDGPDARGRPARARGPRELPLQRPRARRHRGLQAAARRRLQRLRRRAPEDQPCPKETPETLGHELHQARRGPCRGDRLKVLDGLGLHQRQAPERAVRPASTRTCGICNLPREITIPQGPLLHDGRQPWRVRGQPRMGAGPEEVDHRQGLRDLLASGPDRQL